MKRCNLSKRRMTKQTNCIHKRFKTVWNNVCLEENDSCCGQPQRLIIHLCLCFFEWSALLILFFFVRRVNRDYFMESTHMGFLHELPKYLKSNKWMQRTSEISDTSSTSVKFLHKAVPCCNLFINFCTYRDFHIKI